jgi:2-iminobutanoate/2-iminopropanoate deaminase
MQANEQSDQKIIHNIGIARQIGSYSDAMEVGPGQRWLYTSGTPGLSLKGELPDNITAQTELAWENTLALLKKADMTVNDIVKITQYLTRREDIPDYSKTRKRFLGDFSPASTLLITPELGWPGMLVEVEIIAAKKV